MSGQQSQSQQQRMRKTVSPGAGSKQGPIRAIVPLSLMQTCSPTRCLKTTASPTRCLKTTASPSHSPPVTWASGDAASKVKTRLSPDNRISPSESSQSPSPICRGGDSKSTKMGGGKSSVSPSFLRRTASVDTIYLLGQWQRDALYLSYCGRLMMDRSTQTPDEFEEADRRPSQKKGSAASNETLEMKYIRQRLQRGPVGGRPHPPSSGGSTSPPSVPSFAPPPRAHPIPIPDIPKLIPRMRSSVEGLNQEIERIVLREISNPEGDDNDRPMAPTPEGHRAPHPGSHQQQSVDTQTPLDRSSSNSSTSSVSPPLAPLLLPMDSLSRPSSTEGSKGSGSPDLEGTHKLATSPHINKFLAREPPDGCEKVKIAEETRNCEYQHQELSKPSMHHFVLLPSQRSAFDPLCKTCGALSNGDVPQNTMLQ